MGCLGGLHPVDRHVRVRWRANFSLYRLECAFLQCYHTVLAHRRIVYRWAVDRPLEVTTVLTATRFVSLWSHFVSLEHVVHAPMLLCDSPSSASIYDCGRSSDYDSDSDNSLRGRDYCCHCGILCSDCGCSSSSDLQYLSDY